MGEGLLAVWVDMPPALQREFDEWYDQEHLPERAAVPGFISAARFVAVDRADQLQRHMALYELTTPAVLETSAYRFLHERPQTALADVVRANRQNQERCVYEKTGAHGKSGGLHKSLTAEHVVSERMAVAEGQESKVRAWLVQQVIPRRLALAKVEACHHFEVLDGQCRLLFLWEVADPIDLDDADWHVGDEQEVRRRITRVYRRLTSFRAGRGAGAADGKSD